VRVVLASASPRRKELLGAILERFDVRSADVDETFSGSPAQDAARLALSKAEAVLALDPATLVIGSDTIVANEQRSYAKPEDAADAAAMLRELQGRPHLVLTGVAVATGGWAPMVSVSETVVEMAELDDAAIDAYVASGRPLDKAGAYAIQDEDVPTVAAWHGCYCSVMGLPLWRVRDLLQEFGVLAREPHEVFPRCAACPERTGAIE
jgi:septum formation protein